ncbi:unnamed protein product [Brassica napus]|uniref:(rape) hypothetical protein n=1 Tax=Brassica napus TaxID=3708 RepID=A0A816YKJ2_BRANA|nr:unnamed protein product [Brassica napus]
MVFIQVALTWWKKAKEQRTEAIRAKNPNPIIKEIPATTRSIAVCTLIHIILLKNFPLRQDLVFSDNYKCL